LKREAEKKRIEVLAAIDTGTFVEPSKLTVGEFFVEHWLPSKRDHIRPTTYRSYAGHARIYINPRLGSTPLQKLTPADVSKFYSSLANGGRVAKPGRAETSLAPATIRRIHVTLRQGLEDALRWGFVARNVASAVRPPRTASPQEMTTWSAQELEAFLDFVRDDDLFALWRLYALTGMRRSEALGLRHADADLDAGTLTINQALVADGSRSLYFSPPKTRAGARTIDLDRVTVATLREHRARQRERRLAFGPGWRDDLGLFFCDGDGGPLHPARISNAFEVHVRRSGLRRIRLHDLRHSWASLALRSNVHPRVVQERLGHSNIAITLGIYSHVAPGMGREAGETVANLLGGGAWAEPSSTGRQPVAADRERHEAAPGGTYPGYNRRSPPG